MRWSGLFLFKTYPVPSKHLLSRIYNHCSSLHHFVLFVLENDFSKSELMTICFDEPNMINHLTILDERNIIITLKVEIFQDYLLDHLKLGLFPNEWYYVQPCVNIHNQQI